MSFFEKILKQLFPTQETSNTQKVPFVTEPIKRSQRYGQNYFRWLNEGAFKGVLHMIEQAYEKKRRNQPDLLNVHILETAYANGFAISYNANLFSEETFCFLFDLMKERVLPMGYRLSVSDRRIYDRATYVETIEKYYLKPHMPQAEGGLFNQLFGNVLLELVLVNNKPSYIKVLVSLYSDRLYTEALPFQEFKAQVLG